MSNRIFGPAGAPLDGDEKPKSPRMEDRLQAAINLWAKGEKDVAFGTALNAIAYQSHGLAGLARLVKSQEDQVKLLTERVKDMEERLKLMPPPTTPPNAEL